MSDLLILVKVFPQSHLNILDQISYDENKLSVVARVTAVAEKNKANKAVIKLLSKYLGVSQSSFELIKGNRCKNKIFRVNNPDSELLNKLHNATK